MAYVECEITEGLRNSEAAVGVLGMDNHRRWLRVERNFLERHNDRYFLPIGVVYADKEREAALIEFPHEADSGDHRVWVKLQHLREEIG